MYNDDYVNNFGSSGETPPEDNSADTAQQSAPLEPDQIYSAPQQPAQGSYNSQNSYNSGSYTPPQPEKKKKKMSAKKKGVAVFSQLLSRSPRPSPCSQREIITAAPAAALL